MAKKISKGGIIWTIIFVFSIGVLVGSLWFSRAYSLVPIIGSSMENTFVDGDVVLCKNNAKVNRGDVVIISGEGVRQTVEGEEQFLIIKRVIAIAGDTIKFSDGNVYLKKSGETEFTGLTEDYIKEPNSTFYPDATDFEAVEESAEILIGENEIYYLGDNRRVSHDSRASDFGTCTTQQIVGVVSNKMIEKKETTKKYYEFIQKIQSFFKKGD